MSSSNDDAKPVKNRGLFQVGAVLGLIALYFAGSWAKERFIDSDRMLLGVHALNSEEAIVMFRDDKAERLLWRIEKIQLGRDEPLWGHSIRTPSTSQTGNGMSVDGGQVVVLDELSATDVVVTALDLGTGEVTWKRSLGQGDGRSSTIVGRDRFVLVDGFDRLHVLDRATGKTLYRHEGYTQNLDYAFTEAWIEILEPTAIEYVELESGRQHRLENRGGSYCRVGEHAYGFDIKQTLRSHDLATGESTEVMPQETPLDSFHAWSCGWQNNPDGSLRLLFGRQDPGLLVAIDLDPASPSGSGRVAWTSRFPVGIQTGDISYGVPNRLDLVWSGEVPRFAPLEIHTPSASGDLDTKLVVVDTHAGTLSRQGPPGAHIANRFTSFKRGKTVFMVMEGRASENAPGTVLAMDTQTGVTHAVSTAGEFRVAPPSVTDAVAWAWTDTSFSRQDNLAITVLDRELQVLETRDPSRAPTADEDAVNSLLGAAPR